MSARTVALEPAGVAESEPGQDRSGAELVPRHTEGDEPVHPERSRGTTPANSQTSPAPLDSARGERVWALALAQDRGTERAGQKFFPPSRLATFAVGSSLRVLRALPRRARERFAAFVGWAVWTSGIRRAVAIDNVAHAFPERSTEEHRGIARAAFRAMSTAMLESVTSDLLSDAEVERAVSVMDWKGLDVLLASHQPVLIASAHLGSWELFAEVMARRGYVFSAVVRPLAGAFNAWLVKSRERAGVELIFQRGALRKMLEAMRRGRAVVQLIDQALPGPEALWVPFFGRPVSTTPAISMAALRSGAPVYVVVAVRKNGQLEMQVDGPVPMPERPTRRESLEAHAAALTAIIERHVRAHPEQWLWLHRRWKQPEPQIARRSSTPA